MSACGHLSITDPTIYAVEDVADASRPGGRRITKSAKRVADAIASVSLFGPRGGFIGGVEISLTDAQHARDYLDKLIKGANRVVWRSDYYWLDATQQPDADLYTLERVHDGHQVRVRRDVIDGTEPDTCEDWCGLDVAHTGECAR